MLAVTADARERLVPLDGDAVRFSLDGALSVLDDPGGRIGIDEASRHDGFRAAGFPGLTSGTRWVRFTVMRGVGMPADWVLAFGEPDIDDIRVYLPDENGGFTETRLGRRLPQADLALAARRHLARLTLPERGPVTVHVRLSSLHKIRFEDSGLWRPDALMAEEARQSTLAGLQFGGLAVLVALYALLGMWLRDGALLLYALFVATTLCRGLTHTGIAALVFPESGGIANYLLSGIGLQGGIVAFILMWDRILDLRANFPVMHRLYLAAGAAVAASLALVMSPAFSRLVPPTQLIMLAAGIGGVAMAGSLLRRNPADTLLRFYLCAFLPIVAAWGVEIAAFLSPAVPSDLGRRMDVAATLIHIAILSVALAYRLGRLQQERMVAEITLAGERLARQRMRTFVEMTSHEFKSPLAVIDSAAQMLAMVDAPDRPEIVGRIATIRRAVHRLVNLIETCLVGERDEEIAARPCPVSPAEIVARAAERNRAPDWPDPVVSHSGLPATCRADPDLLGIALDALIDNARRYGGSTHPVEIAARSEDCRIAFMVKDRGPGVTKDAVDRIFEKYYRGPAAAGIPGTGLGLHLVKTIAELHGGEVACRPRAGGGAVFVLSIPALS